MPSQEVTEPECMILTTMLWCLLEGGGGRESFSHFWDHSQVQEQVRMQNLFLIFPNLHFLSLHRVSFLDLEGMGEHSRLGSGGNGIVWESVGMTSMEAMNRLIWLSPQKALKASRERKWESEAEVDYRALGSHAKEFEYYYIYI